MGYQTAYELYVLGTDDSEKIIKDLRESCSSAKDSIDEFGNYFSSEKWYDHEKDMKEFSKKYPKIVFKLEGIGDERGDFWHKYFKNGKVQVCEGEIVYPPYRESELE